MSAKDKIRDQLAHYLNRSPDKVPYDSELTDLVSDSFRLVEIAIELQEDFDVRLVQEDLKTVKTVDDLTELIASRQAA